MPILLRMRVFFIFEGGTCSFRIRRPVVQLTEYCSGATNMAGIYLKVSELKGRIEFNRWYRVATALKSLPVNSIQALTISRDHAENMGLIVL